LYIQTSAVDKDYNAMKDRCDELEEVKNDQAKGIQSLAAQIETIRMSSVHNEPNVLEAECQTDLQSKAWDDMLARFSDLEAEYERVKTELSRSCPKKANSIPKSMTKQRTDDDENVKEIRHLNMANEELATENNTMAENTSCLEETVQILHAAHGVMAVDYDEKVEKNICLDEAKEKLHEANDQLEMENKGMTEKIRWLEEAEEDLKEDIRYNKMEIQDLKEQVQMRTSPILKNYAIYVAALFFY
jgi:chromosome segregation ATPase